jgi:Nif-specific regulatory protein
MRREDALFTPHRHDAPAERTRDDLAALIRINTVLNAVRGLAALERPLLELIADVIPADRGALLLARELGADAAPVASWSRKGGPVPLDKVWLAPVLREAVGILSASRLAAPLIAFDIVIGAIVLESSDGSPFDRGHLTLLMAIAGTVATTIDHARQREWLEGENRRLQAKLDAEYNMVGDSAAMRDVYKFIARVAPTASTVLITGESGTGKELVARAVHSASRRADRPFVAINCAAITETLLESELFGHEKGAFTGAVAQKRGLLETAEGGTVFLDEIGELSAALQAKLLRVLQEHEFERVGGTRKVRVDFRLVTATNRDLEAAIAAGTFRRDLFYRLNVVSIALPALRDRRDDIPRLASYFARRHGEQAGRRVEGFSAEALACLTAYDWPGNVRELDNTVERAVVLGSTPLILPDDLPDAIVEAAPSATAGSGTLAAGPGPVGDFHDAVKHVKKDLIVRAVEQAGGNYTAAARLLGLHPNYLHRLIKNLQLRTSLRT